MSTAENVIVGTLAANRAELDRVAKSASRTKTITIAIAVKALV